MRSLSRSAWLRRVAGTILVVLLAQVAAPRAAPDSLDALTVPELLTRADTLPPAGLYLLASRLFAEGRREDATRWLYVAQIRARYRLITSPGLSPDGEPALYAALQETIGRPINEWAFGDIPAVAARMQEALDWDDAHPNAVTPKTRDAAALERIRGGLAQLRLRVLADQADIRRQRGANGLGAR